MSWLDRINNDLIIITGDGKTFTPEWTKTGRTVLFNTVEFNFPNVPGSFLDRREAKGNRFNLEIYFQGADHLDLAEEFIESAKDNRFWTLTHPMYGNMVVQPLSMAIDNKSDNISKFTIPLIETIANTNPRTVIIAEDKILEDTGFLNVLSAENFDGSIDVKSGDVNDMEQLVDEYYSNGKNDIDNDEDGQLFFNTFNTAKAAVANSLDDADAAMIAMQNLIQKPASFKQSVESRFKILKRNFNSLQASVDEAIQSVGLSNRFIYEFSQMAVLSGMAVASSTPFSDADYQNRNQVAGIVTQILANNESYLSTLDGLQIGDGNNPDDFIPNQSSMIDLNDLINFTTGNLFNIGLDAKQERFLTLEEDTDFVNLAHRLYGPKQDDSHIAEIMRNNPLGLNGILVIKKETLITYYI